MAVDPLPGHPKADGELGRTLRGAEQSRCLRREPLPARRLGATTAGGERSPPRLPCPGWHPLFVLLLLSPSVCPAKRRRRHSAVPSAALPGSAPRLEPPPIPTWSIPRSPGQRSLPGAAAAPPDSAGPPELGGSAGGGRRPPASPLPGPGHAPAPWLRPPDPAAPPGPRSAPRVPHRAPGLRSAPLPALRTVPQRCRLAAGGAAPLVPGGRCSPLHARDPALWLHGSHPQASLLLPERSRTSVGPRGGPARFPRGVPHPPDPVPGAVGTCPLLCPAGTYQAARSRCCRGRAPPVPLWARGSARPAFVRRWR